jgi:hypothetical protein
MALVVLGYRQGMEKAIEVCLVLQNDDAVD